VVIVSVFQRGKAGVGCRASGSITWDVTWLVWEVERSHVVHHMTCLGASRDYTSRRDLESSKIQHVILKMFRDERWIATKSTITERFFQREAAHVQKSRYNSLYCTNRTSLENSFYVTSDSIYTRGHGSYWKVMEGYGRRQKQREGYGTLWKSLENARTVHR